MLTLRVEHGTQNVWHPKRRMAPKTCGTQNVVWHPNVVSRPKRCVAPETLWRANAW